MRFGAFSFRAGPDGAENRCFYRAYLRTMRVRAIRVSTSDSNRVERLVPEHLSEKSKTVRNLLRTCLRASHRLLVRQDLVATARYVLDAFAIEKFDSTTNGFD